MSSTGVVHVSSHRVSYGDVVEDAPLREVDQLVTYITEPISAGPISIELVAHVPIECKHRGDVAVFGFPDTRDRDADVQEPATYPVMSELVGSRFLDELMKVSPDFIDTSDLASLSLVKLRDGTPAGIDNEQLAYKSAAALYDFVNYDIRSLSYLIHSGDDTAEDKILRRFLAAWRKGRHEHLSSWLRDHRRLVTKYNKSVYADRYRRHHPVSVYLPLICVDMPLIQADLDRDGTLVNVREVTRLATSIRTRDWATRIMTRGISATPESLVVMVHVDSLESTLIGISSWINSIVNTADECGGQWGEQALLEANIARFLEEEFAPSTYRSDHGFS